MELARLLESEQENSASAKRLLIGGIARLVEEFDADRLDRYEKTLSVVKRSADDKLDQSKRQSEHCRTFLKHSTESMELQQRVCQNDENRASEAFEIISKVCLWFTGKMFHCSLRPIDCARTVKSLSIQQSEKRLCYRARLQPCRKRPKRASSSKQRILKMVRRHAY
jgi:hypothetical protein